MQTSPVVLTEFQHYAKERHWRIKPGHGKMVYFIHAQNYFILLYSIQTWEISPHGPRSPRDPNANSKGKQSSTLTDNLTDQWGWFNSHKPLEIWKGWTWELRISGSFTGWPKVKFRLNPCGGGEASYSGNDLQIMLLTQKFSFLMDFYLITVNLKDSQNQSWANWQLLAQPSGTENSLTHSHFSEQKRSLRRTLIMLLITGNKLFLFICVCW